MFRRVVEKVRGALRRKNRYEIDKLVDKAFSEIGQEDDPRRFVLIHMHNKDEIGKHVKNNIEGISAVEIDGFEKERAVVKILANAIRETFDKTTIPVEHLQEDISRLKTLENLMSVPSAADGLGINELALAEIVKKYEERYRELLRKIEELRQREDIAPIIEKNHKIIGNKLAQILILLHKNGVIQLMGKKGNSR